MVYLSPAVWWYICIQLCGGIFVSGRALVYLSPAARWCTCPQLCGGIFVSHGASLGRSVDLSRCRLDARSLGRSVAGSLGRSVARSLDRSVARSVGRSVDRSLGRSVARTSCSACRGAFTNQLQLEHSLLLCVSTFRLRSV